MYSFRGRPLVRCVFGPLVDASVAIGTPLVGLVVAVALSRWVGSGGAFLIFAGWLAIFEVGAYRSNVQADAKGVTMRNAILRYHVPWADVNGIWVRKQGRLAGKIVVERCHPSPVRRFLLLDPVTAYASVGASPDANVTAAKALIALASQHGYHVAGGSERDIPS